MGVCGGNATETDCQQATAGCPTCTIVCHPDDLNCQGDFNSIQAAIDYVEEGDTVLVENGHYYENLIIQKSITLISRGALDDLSSWMVYDDGYVLGNQNIVESGNHDELVSINGVYKKLWDIQTGKTSLD